MNSDDKLRLRTSVMLAFSNAVNRFSIGMTDKERADIIKDKNIILLIIDNQLSDEESVEVGVWLLGLLKASKSMAAQEETIDTAWLKELEIIKSIIRVAGVGGE